ncbi:MAG: DUF1598 domain-containing protein, partial [Thermoguttaceae bacterium]|nr:DUF1598 domain-containing protein [Thermoguttaceae bacterium]
QPDGLLQRMPAHAALDEIRAASAYQGIPSEMSAKSALRKVSLNRLEAAIKANGGVVTEEMAHLAGLTRIENVFFYPETNDIVIAGPAEGWQPGVDGSTVGVTSQRPTLQLADLVTALRAYPANGPAAEKIGCSIDPTPEGLVSMKNFLQTEAKPSVDNQLELTSYAEGIRDALGDQTVSFWGVSPKTHFAASLAAADYRMKLIGIGLEEAPVPMVTYIEKSTPMSMSRNALVRWYFQPDYNCVVQSTDEMAIELVGDSVQLVGADELVTETGNRRESKGRMNKASKLFANSFTKQFSKIAEKVPVYAELRDLIDMSVVAAWIQKQGLYEKAGWSMDLFGSEEKFPVEVGSPIERAETAVNIVSHGSSTVSFPTGGGVLIEPESALSAEHIQSDTQGKVQKKYTEVGKAIPADVWWWD